MPLVQRRPRSPSVRRRLDIGYVALQHPCGKVRRRAHQGPGASDRSAASAGDGLDHLALAVPDGASLETWAAHLTEVGIHHDGIVLEGGHPSLQLRDPDRHCDRTGRALTSGGSPSRDEGEQLVSSTRSACETVASAGARDEELLDGLRPIGAQPLHQVVGVLEHDLPVVSHHVEMNGIGVDSHREIRFAVEDEAPEWCGTRGRPRFETPSRSASEQIEDLVRRRASAYRSCSAPSVLRHRRRTRPDAASVRSSVQGRHRLHQAPDRTQANSDSRWRTMALRVSL